MRMIAYGSCAEDLAVEAELLRGLAHRVEVDAHSVHARPSPCPAAETYPPRLVRCHGIRRRSIGGSRPPGGACPGRSPSCVFGELRLFEAIWQLATGRRDVARRRGGHRLRQGAAARRAGLRRARRHRARGRGPAGAVGGARLLRLASAGRAAGVRVRHPLDRAVDGRGADPAASGHGRGPGAALGPPADRHRAVVEHPGGTRAQALQRRRRPAHARRAAAGHQPRHRADRAHGRADPVQAAAPGGHRHQPGRGRPGGRLRR